MSCLLLGLFIATGPTACTSSAARSSELAALAQELESGKTVVAVLIDVTDKGLLESEAYADWQSYFARFSADAKSRVKLHVVPPKAGRELLRLPPRVPGSATVFVRPGGSALLHEGLVLEPHVYEIGLAYLETGSVPPDAGSYGLAEVRVN